MKYFTQRKNVYSCDLKMYVFNESVEWSTVMRSGLKQLGITQIEEQLRVSVDELGQYAQGKQGKM